MKLTLGERLRLLEILPTEGNRMNLKIVRKLRETLSFNEAEIKLVPSVYEFRCLECGVQKYSADPPQCNEHGSPMVATGNWQILDVTSLNARENEKEIHFGDEAIKLAEAPLKRLEDTDKLTEQCTSLYDKFFPPREEESDASQGEKG